MKTIIVPFDFSAEAMNAADYACRLAQDIESSILFIHFLPLPVTISEIAIPIEDYSFTLSRSESYLASVKKELLIRNNVTINISWKVTSESFLDYIRNLNLNNNDYLGMVMGAKGIGMTEAQLLGSFSLVAAKHFRHPLMIIPKECTYKKVEKIGLACDMKNVSATLPIKYITAVVKVFKASLDILYVSESDENMYPEVLIESKAVQHSLAHLHPQLRITTHENVEAGLAAFSRKSNIDILLVVPKERNFIQKLLHKSISHQLVIHPSIPILLLHNQKNFCLL